MKDNKFLNAALRYEKLGLCVVPVKQKSKKAFIQWTEFQERKATPEEIRVWWKKWPNANVAIVTGKVSGVDILDADSQAGLDALSKFLPDSFLTPISKTPNNKGWHYWFKHRPGLQNQVKALTDCDIRTTGGYAIAPPSRGLNGTGAYRWLENLSLEQVTPCPMPDTLFDILHEQCRGAHGQSATSREHVLKNDASLYNNNVHYLGGYRGDAKPAATSGQQTATKRNISFEQGGRDNALFSVANCLVKGGMPHANIEYCLTFLAQNCKPPFPKKEIPAKIKSAFDRANRREKGLTEAIREFVGQQWGNISATSALQGATNRNIFFPEERKKARVILGRLVKEGVLERVPDRDGWYRKVDSECEDIDIFHAPTKNFDVKYPFQIEELVETMPGNVIVVAGEIESGKSAFLLNLAKLNMKKHPVYYFSSEMGASEMRKRLSKFDYMTLDDWKPLKVKARGGDFHDVIKPDAINLIDFLEVHEDFFKIGKPLKQIHDKLKKGIAVVAIQKPPGRDEALGGGRSMEVARLYISLFKDYPGTKLKIVKGKNWATERNPNELSLKYKIVGGCNLIQASDWKREEK